MRYSSIVALAMGNVAMGQFTNSSMPLLTPTATESKTSAVTPTQSAGPGPLGRVGDFTYLGCFASKSGFPTFALAYGNKDNTAEKCAAACQTQEFMALYDDSCYCGAVLADDNSIERPGDACNVACPGDKSQSCGGLDLVRRQNIPINILLSIYIRVNIRPPVTVTNTLTGSTTVTETITRTTTGTITSCPPNVPCTKGALTTGVTTITTTYCPEPTKAHHCDGHCGEIVCYGDKCHPKNPWTDNKKYRVVCKDGHCYPEECKNNEEWDKLVICKGNDCYYHSCQGDECFKEIVCVGEKCQGEAPKPKPPTGGEKPAPPTGGESGAKPAPPAGGESGSKPAPPAGGESGSKPAPPAGGESGSKPAPPAGGEQPPTQVGGGSKPGQPQVVTAGAASLGVSAFAVLAAALVL